MKKNCLLIQMLILIFLGFIPAQMYAQKTDTLYKRVAALDSVFFTAYNDCNIALINEMISENIEFYHDLGGLSTSKKDIVAATEKNICGKVKRELKPGSIEVSPIKDYGAVEIGFHRFHNLTEGSVSKFSRFVHLWKQEGGQWRLARVISLH